VQGNSDARVGIEIDEGLERVEPVEERLPVVLDGEPGIVAFGEFGQRLQSLEKARIFAVSSAAGQGGALPRIATPPPPCQGSAYLAYPPM
jgi:hypothetical protein